MGDHQTGVGDQSGHRVIIERLVADVVIGDAGEPADLFRHGRPGIQAGITVADAVENALGREVERQDGKLDDLVARGIEAGRLDVDDQATAQLGTVRWLGIVRDGQHAAHPVAPVCSRRSANASRSSASAMSILPLSKDYATPADDARQGISR